MEGIDKKVLCVGKNCKLYKLQEAIRGYREEVLLSLEMDLSYNCGALSLEELENKGFIFEEEFSEFPNRSSFLPEVGEQKTDNNSRYRRFIFSFNGIEVVFSKDDSGNFVFEKFKGDITINDKL